MEDLPGLIIFLFVAVAVAAYVAALVGYTIFVAPFVAGAAALFAATALIVDYGVVVRGVMFARTAQFQVLPPYRPEDEPEPAYRQYFFGPAVRDLRQVVMIAPQRCQQRAQRYGSRITVAFITAPPVSGLFTVPIGLTLWLGLVVGVGLAAVIGGCVAIVHIAAVATVQILARASIGILRAIDSVTLRVKGIRGMLCPWCYERSAYPSYECPQCHRRHRDVRPGKYGVLRRRCQCGDSLPTLLLLGSYAMPAMCTNLPRCGRQMSDETGRFAELVLPFFGGRSAGKTRLMAAMIMGLDEAGAELGASIALADAETRHSYDVLREVLDIEGNTLGTRGELPRAHSVQVAIGRSTRLMHIFDAAGERFVDIERTDELRYLSAARVFVFVLDPMALPQFWAQLTPGERDDLDPALGSDMLPETVFHQSVQTMIQMGAKVHRARLAVAISKTDVIEHTAILDGRRDDSSWAERWLTESLGQGNLVRAMQNEFAEVRFFFTAAVTVGQRKIHDSVPPVVSWCLRHESHRRGGLMRRRD